MTVYVVEERNPSSKFDSIATWRVAGINRHYALYLTLSSARRAIRTLRQGNHSSWEFRIVALSNDHVDVQVDE